MSRIPVGIGRQRAVVEGEHHFFIEKRKRLRIVHRANPAMLARIDHDGAAGAERVGAAGAFAGRGRDDAAAQSQRRSQQENDLCQPHVHPPVIAPGDPRRNHHGFPFTSNLSFEASNALNGIDADTAWIAVICKPFTDRLCDFHSVGANQCRHKFRQLKQVAALRW